MFNFAYAGTGTLPLTATDVAVRWDGLYTFLVWVSIFFFVLVVGGMLYFMITYRHRSGTTSRYITGNHLLEWIWVGLPTLLLLVIFGWGYSVYHEMVQAPYDAYEIRVVAKQWLWTFQYDTGKTMAGEVYVPLNRPVKLVMSSQDVLHSFFIPNFRIKQDVVPGMYSSVWFTATVPGKHQVFCAEYCGTSHSGMMAQIIVLDEVQWERFLNGQKLAEVHQAGTPGKDITLQKVSPGLSLEHYAQAEPTQVLSLIHQGKALYQSVGCATCHSVDGSAKIGPTLLGLYGSSVELNNGQTVVADEAYIRHHIENPQSNTVRGYAPVMPTFKGIINELEMNALLAYIKSLKSPEAVVQ